ncbi:hypothetical protein H0H87_009514 [Tephrocybe sp. NHM501043]|nr:hypothetical protein H0H87_009514 [Tephrocybe sp. NHM501043]
MASYNTTRFVEDLLERTVALPPSFTVHLHPEHWTLNNGSKFLYNNQIASLLDDVRAHRIPVDFLDLFEAAKVPFYDGCMIVELLDYRPQRSKEPTPDKPERTRAVLHPNSETLWADICAMNQRFGGKWTDRDALEMEARLVLATSPPLCLDPNPHLSRVANHVMRVSTPTVPVSLKRKALSSDLEEDETDKARRAKIMAFMNNRQGRAAPNYRILDAIQRHRTKAADPDRIPTPASIPPAPSPTKPPTPAITISQAQSPAPVETKPVVPTAAPVAAFSRTNGSATPAPQQTNTHQFINTTPTNVSTPNTHSPLLPQTYPNVQAATEAAKRAPTPAQIKQFTPSPRPPSRAPTTLPISSTPIPTQQTPQALQPPLTNAFQAPAQAAQFANRGVPTKLAPPTNGNRVPITPQHQQHLYKQQHLLALQQAAAQKAAQAGQQNGRGTPAQLGVGNAPSPSAVARNSPMATKQPLAARSPMPPTTQLLMNQTQQQITQHALAIQHQHQQAVAAQQAAQQQASQPGQHPSPHTFTPSYNPAQLRPGIVHGNTQVPANLAAAQAQAQGQGQRPTSTAPTQQQIQQMPMYMPPQMYYQPMNYPPGQALTPQQQQQQAQIYQFMRAKFAQQQQQQAASKAASPTGIQGR